MVHAGKSTAKLQAVKAAHLKKSCWGVRVEPNEGGSDFGPGLSDCPQSLTDHNFAAPLIYKYLQYLFGKI